MNNTDTLHSSYTAALFLSGLCYLCIFSVLSLLTAKENNIDPAALIMLINIPEHIVQSLSTYALPDFNGKEDYAFLFSLGVLYGSSLLIGSLIPFSVIIRNMAHQKIHIITATTGLGLGYYTTVWFSEYFNMFGPRNSGLIVYWVKF